MPEGNARSADTKYDSDAITLEQTTFMRFVVNGPG